MGQITRDLATNSSWRFELIRCVDAQDLYRQEPFGDANNVVGLLDHQKPCTLVRPIVERIDPGSLDVKNKSQRTVITGVFQALLSDIPACDGDAQRFLGIAFESEALDLWYGAPAFDGGFDFQTRTPTLAIKPTERDTFTVGGFGEVTVTRTARLVPRHRSSSLRSAAIFKVQFESPKSLNEVMSLGFGLERLFGFLIGFRGPYPSFTTWLGNKIKAGEVEINYDGTLEIGGVAWSDGDYPSVFSCVHRKGIAGAELPSILENFFAQEKDIVDRIHAVEFSRFFSHTLNDRFAVALPVLDSYVQGRYKADEEKSFIAAQSEFFAWVDQSPSEGVREFSKKHLSIKASKAPGLKTLLSRAIKFVNGKGFCFDPSLAGRIQVRRGQLFHAAPQMDKEEVLNFSLEVQAVTGLLQLQTLDDLGIDISYLAKNHRALPHMRPFMKSPERPLNSTQSKSERDEKS